LRPFIGRFASELNCGHDQSHIGGKLRGMRANRNRRAFYDAAHFDIPSRRLGLAGASSASPGELRQSRIGSFHAWRLTQRPEVPKIEGLTIAGKAKYSTEN
jgi:hypothetical protein